MTKKLTCIEYSRGCAIEIIVEDEVVNSVKGNGCLKGKVYAETEIICPKRVETSVVRSENGEMIPVKTDRPIKKTSVFEIMKKIKEVVCLSTVKIGDVIIKNVSDGANLIVTANN